MEKSEERKNIPIFRNLEADDMVSETTVMESLCMNCNKNGLTKLLLTRIPYYKDVILMSFECEHCGFQNNEIQSGGKINEKGVRIRVEIIDEKDLNRQVVKSDYTSVKIPKLDFEIPAQSQKGEITTIEGIIDRSITALEQDQLKRREQNPETAADIDLFISKLSSLKILDEPFIVIFEDITGETCVENPNAPQKDHRCVITHFIRSEDDNKLLGIFAENNDKFLKPLESESFPLESLEGEILMFPTNCSECNTPCSTNMRITIFMQDSITTEPFRPRISDFVDDPHIPHFKAVVIMATSCDTCGYRTNEVKSGGGIEPEGIKIEINVQGYEDFTRDILKSETCSIEIPELGLEVGPAALGGRFTTVEGLLAATKDQLVSSSVIDGDSTDETARKRMVDFISKFDEILNGKGEVTIILDDPAGNSYVQSLSDIGCDEKLKITKYKRTFEQNEELGINDMRVEDYENDLKKCNDS